MERLRLYSKSLYVILVVSAVTYLFLHSGLSKNTLNSHYGRPTNAVNVSETGTEMDDSGEPRSRLNVLLLISDDLRPQLGCYRGRYFPNPYGSSRISTPHLDALARRSLLLNRAYAQFSLCAPSRTSFLTGRRPDTTKVWDLVTYWRESGGDFTTLPQHFKNNGYITVGTGKTFHGGTSAKHFDRPSWSIKYKRPVHAGYWNLNSIKDTWKAVSQNERMVNPLPDEEITDQAIGHMRHLAEDARTGKRNFLIAVGLHKPHLPWVFPEEFLELYPLEEMDVPDNKYLPWRMPQCGWTQAREFPLFDDIKRLLLAGAPNETYPDDVTKILRRAYFACVSYIDSLVGKILKELDDLGLVRNTVVVFLGDHGFHLGENGHWGKHTNFEQGAHAPLMIHIPGRTDHGVVSDALVEFVDIFPTVVEAAGLDPIPTCPKTSGDVQLCTEGVSFLSLVENPDLQLKDAAYSQMARDDVMGYSMRTNRYRYTEWLPLKIIRETGDLFSYEIMWEKRCGMELYDHKVDPEERYNRAGDTELERIRKVLSSKLRDFVGETIENSTTRLA